MGPLDLARFVRRLLRTDRGLWRQGLEAAVRQSGRSRPGLVLDCVLSTLRYELGPLDFFKYGFGVRTAHDERRRWVGSAWLSRCLPRLNAPDQMTLFRDKGLFRERFATFPMPAGLVVRTVADAGALGAFLASLPGPGFVVKPLAGTSGKGVSAHAVADVPSPGDFVARLDLPVLVEERLQGHPALSRIAPTALNTLRVMTFLHRDGSVEVLTAMIRFAIEGVVDNGQQGGVGAPVDLASGVVVGPAWGHHPVVHGPYEHHPRSGLPILGLAIPRWDEVLKLSDALARVVPTARFIGWDLAVTSHGVVLVEGNWAPAPFVWQIPVNQGLRPVLDRLLAEVDGPEGQGPRP